MLSVCVRVCVCVVLALALALALALVTVCAYFCAWGFAPVYMHGVCYNMAHTYMHVYVPKEMNRAVAVVWFFLFSLLLSPSAVPFSLW